MQNVSMEQEDRSLIFHPYNIIMVLTIGSLTMLFLALTAAFVYSRVQNGVNMPEINFPPIFLVNTLILLGSSATLQWAKKCYLQDETANYQKALLYTIVLSFLFMISQYLPGVLYSPAIFLLILIFPLLIYTRFLFFTFYMLSPDFPF